MKTCRVCNVELNENNHYYDSGRICKDCKNRARRPEKTGDEKSGYISKKYIFQQGRRIQAKYSQPHISRSSSDGQSDGSCPECNGIIRHNNKNELVCEQCGIVIEELNVVRPCDLHIDYRRVAKYHIPIAAQVFNDEDDFYTLDTYYSAAYSSGKKSKIRIEDTNVSAY